MLSCVHTQFSNLYCCNYEITGTTHQFLRASPNLSFKFALHLEGWFLTPLQTLHFGEFCLNS